MNFKEFLRKAPFIRIVVPFIIGILLEESIGAGFKLVSFFSVIALVALVSVYLSSLSSHYRFRWVFGVLLHVTFGLFGMALFAWKNEPPKLETVWNRIIEGTLVENPKVGANSISLLIQVAAVNENRAWKKARFKTVVYSKIADVGNLHPGARILVKGSLNRIKNFGNPYEFDYAKYMRNNGIFFTMYAEASNVKVFPERHGFNLQVWAVKVRNLVLGYFKNLGMSPPALGVVSALTVGDKSYLNNDIQSIYINSGTIHILAVSGMHVALLFWLLQRLTFPLIYIRRGKIVQAVIVITVIWGYAIITGLSASVIRAAVMFTIWMVGESYKRNTNVYNTIAASAFGILAYNPDSIFDVGFQLSYLAVLGIVMFYKSINNWVYSRIWVVNKIWQMIAVSIAAQIVTLPVTLFYFHQFPNYFLLANIVALPLSTGIIYASIFILVFIPFPHLWYYIGKILGFAIDFLNHILQEIEHLPYSVTSGIHITGVMTVFFYCFIISLLLFIYRKKLRYFQLALGMAIVFLVLNLFEIVKTKTNHAIIVYNASKSLTISYIEGNQCVTITDDSDSVHLQYLLKPVCDHQRIRQNRIVHLNDSLPFRCNSVFVCRNFIFIGEKLLFVSRSGKWNKSVNFPVKTDLIFMQNVNPFTFKCPVNTFDCKRIVYSGRLTANEQKTIKGNCANPILKIHSLSENGAMLYEL